MTDFNALRRFLIDPISKPRMTQADKWTKRKCVTEYWDYKDKLRKLNVELPESGAHIEFHIPFPKSYSKKKRNELRGEPHQQVPDVDNMLKGVMDALYENDCTVWDVRISKYWADEGMITIRKEVS